jgi:hypothetical protein
MKKQGKNELEQFRKNAIIQAMKDNKLNVSDDGKWFLIAHPYDSNKFLDANDNMTEVTMEKQQSKK